MSGGRYGSEEEAQINTSSATPALCYNVLFQLDKPACRLIIPLLHR